MRLRTLSEWNGQGEVGEYIEPPDDYNDFVDRPDTMLKYGLLEPGQKWATPHSEGRMKLSSIAEDTQVYAYVNPDSYLETANAVTLIYSTDNKIYYGNSDQAHDDVLQANPEDAKKMCYVEGYPLRLSRGPAIHNGNLFGRIGNSGHLRICAFWNDKKEHYQKLLPACLEKLIADGHIANEDWFSTPLTQTVPIGKVVKAEMKPMSPEDTEKYELYKKMHLMRGAEKQAAMKKLGVGGGGKPHPMQAAMTKAGLLKPGQKWATPHSEGRMKLSSIAESKEPFFSYEEITKDMWRSMVNDEQDRAKIHFDLENDDDVTQRVIVIDQDYWDTTKCKFKCELRKAGGDWQIPCAYFRCQIVDGYAKGFSTYGTAHFIYIPGKDEGNGHLVKSKNGHSAPDDDGHKQLTSDNTLAWKSLKKYLQKLVNDEIAAVKKTKE